MIDYEKQHKTKKKKAEFGYALVWFFALLLMVVLPLWLNMGTSIFQWILAAGAFTGMILKIFKGINLIRTVD